MEGLEAIEVTMTNVLKPRGFRKRGRNWFRTTTASQYQVVNFQKSSWGGGNCYLNLGWDPDVPAKGFRAENQCCVTIRAERTDVIPPIQRVRPDGLTTTEFPGITLLSSEMYNSMSGDQLVEEFTEVVAKPIADLMDRTPAILDLLPLLQAKPWFATRTVRDYLKPLGHELPTEW